MGFIIGFSNDESYKMRKRVSDVMIFLVSMSFRYMDTSLCSKHDSNTLRYFHSGFTVERPKNIDEQS